MKPLNLSNNMKSPLKEEDRKNMLEKSLEELSDEQRNAFDDVNEGRHTLITGMGGAGKSFLLDHITDILGCQVTASTGIAALNVGGATIHSWTGLGIGRTKPDKLVSNLKYKELRFNDRTLRRIERTQRLAIDEISMLDGRYLTLVDEFLRRARKQDIPFGGIQMVFLGDFLQLPPVTQVTIPQFAFETDVWKEMDVKIHMLTKSFRQDDQWFVDLLQKVRMGERSMELLQYLNDRFVAVDPHPEVPGMVVHTHNAGCDQLNAEGLAKCQGKEQTYKASDWGVHESFINQLDRSCLAPKELTLRVGCRVMLLKNVDIYGGLANGSMGTVVDLHDKEVHVQFDSRSHPTEIDTAEWELTNGDETLAKQTQIR